MTRNYYIVGAALIVAVLAATALVYPYLPARVPMHWNTLGTVDQWGARWTLFAITPGVMVAILLLFSALASKCGMIHTASRRELSLSGVLQAWRR